MSNDSSDAMILKSLQVNLIFSNPISDAYKSCGTMIALYKRTKAEIV